MTCHRQRIAVAARMHAESLSGLSPEQVDALARRLRDDAPEPDRDAVVSALYSQHAAAAVDPDLTSGRRQRILAHLSTAIDDIESGGDLDDTAALVHLPAASAAAAAALKSTVRAAARQQRTDPDKMAAKFNRWRREDDYDDVEAPDPTFRPDGSSMPDDPDTARALRKLGHENYLAQRAPVFVYGTLRANQANAGRMGTAIGSSVTAKAPGLAIYGPRWGFPYAQPSPDGQGHTVGDLVYLHDDWNGDRARKSLDQLEGFSSDRAEHCHYFRVLRDVTYTDADGRMASTKAWTYVAADRFTDRLTPGERIADGDWVAAKDAYRAAPRRTPASAARTESHSTGNGRSARDSAAAFEAAFSSVEAAEDADALAWADRRRAMRTQDRLRDALD